MKSIVTILFTTAVMGFSGPHALASASDDMTDLQMAPAHLSADLLGGISEGGGKSVVCRNDKTKAIKSAQVLDLYEAQYQWQLKIYRTNEPVDLQVRRAIAKLKVSGIFDFATLSTKEVTESLRFLNKGDRLQEIDDALAAVIPACPVEQLANYFNRQTVLVNSDIWKSMTNTDRAALIVHEAIYRFDRVNGAKDSRRARRIVGELFSDRNIFTESPIPKLPSTYGYCTTIGVQKRGKPYTSFYYTPSKGGYALYFEVINGERKLTPTTAIVFPEPSKIVGEEFQTVGAFESGDFIHIGRLEQPTTGDDSSSGQLGLYLEGQSGWLPQTSFVAQGMSCWTTSVAKPLYIDISPSIAVISPGPLYSCHDRYVNAITGQSGPASVVGPVVEFPHFALDLPTGDQVDISRIRVTISAQEIKGGNYSFDLPSDEIEALLGTTKLRGPVKVASDGTKSNGAPSCGLTVGGIPFVDGAHSFTADVHVQVTGTGTNSDKSGQYGVESVVAAQARYIVF